MATDCKNGALVYLHNARRKALDWVSPKVIDGIKARIMSDKIDADKAGTLYDEFGISKRQIPRDYMMLIASELDTEYSSKASALETLVKSSEALEGHLPKLKDMGKTLCDANETYKTFLDAAKKAGIPELGAESEAWERIMDSSISLEQNLGTFVNTFDIESVKRLLEEIKAYESECRDIHVDYGQRIRETVTLRWDILDIARGKVDENEWRKERAELPAPDPIA